LVSKIKLIIHKDGLVVSKKIVKFWKGIVYCQIFNSKTKIGALMTTSGFFEGLMQWNVERNGTIRPLPYLYYDCRSFAAVYTASTSKVRNYIPNADLHLLELLPGRCLTAFAVFEYRKTSGDPYNEISVSFIVSYRKHPLPFVSISRMMVSGMVSSYVWQLPVNTEDARAGGVDLFGFPKFLADIDISSGHERIGCSLSVSGKEIINISGPVLPTKQGKPFRYVSYAIEGSSMVSVNMLLNALDYAESRNNNAVDLVIGEGHPICDALRGIDLAERPLIYRYIPRSEAILFPARNLKDI